MTILSLDRLAELQAKAAAWDLLTRDLYVCPVCHHVRRWPSSRAPLCDRAVDHPDPGVDVHPRTTNPGRLVGRDGRVVMRHARELLGGA